MVGRHKFSKRRRTLEPYPMEPGIGVYKCLRRLGSFNLLVNRAVKDSDLGADQANTIATDVFARRKASPLNNKGPPAGILSQCF